MHPEPATIPVELHQAIGRFLAESSRTVREYQVADLGFGLKAVTVAYNEFHRGLPGMEPTGLVVFARAADTEDGRPRWEAIHRRDEARL